MGVYPAGIRTVINIVITVLVFSAWVKMFLDSDGGMLASSGIHSLRYFTVLSNIFEGIVSALWLLAAAGVLNMQTADRMKYIGCMAISLTFFTVMCFLGPVFGFEHMFNGSNLFFHLIIPVLAMLEFIILNRSPITMADTLISLVPMLLYCIGYIANILMHGLEGNDWYGFFARGVKMGIALNLIMGVAMFLLGTLFRVANARLFQ